MQTTTEKPLSAPDFVYVYEPGIGQTYQCGRYLILAPGYSNKTYRCSYNGQMFSIGNEDFLFAVEACARHEARYRS
jgi:hypothetical protein